ncbi:MAG: hypothetical protein ABS35_27320 [Kaistia sp. SCN 65-12]|nr:MAG: hypothetical protein ABS35_27320 [Kaistia sp. SCN 65-12]
MAPTLDLGQARPVADRTQAGFLTVAFDADQLRDCGIDPFDGGRVLEVAARRSPNIDIRS